MKTVKQLSTRASMGAISALFLFGIASCREEAPISTTEEPITVTEPTVEEPTSSDSDMADATYTQAIKIAFSGTTATITGSVEGVATSVSEGVVSIQSTAANVNYQIVGSTDNGGLDITSTQPFMITLNGANLTRKTAAPITISSSVNAYIKSLSGSASLLSDAADNTMGTTIYSKGSLLFSGSGALGVKSLSGDAIQATGDVSLRETALTIGSSTDDGIQAKGSFSMQSGTLGIASTGTDVKGVKTGGVISIEGGTITMTVAGNQSKGLKSGTTTTISGGEINISTSGNVALEASNSGYDPSYCTAIKADTDVILSGGNITISSTGIAGKGISPDGNFTMTGGTLTINTSGGGATYTDPDGTLDSYSATGLSPDGDCYLYGGTLYIKSTGAAGKGISVDGNLAIGESTKTNGPSIEIHTTGAKFYVSGSGQDADYANPKAIKSDESLTVNSGTINITGAQDGAEGLESKAIMNIRGGTINITTVDDCINASEAVNISGGKLYCYSSGNDGIDSNGTISISGGTIIASGANSPEAGIDSDNSQFAITGGTLVGLGGSSSSPSATASTQRSLLYRGLSLSEGQLIAIVDSSGSNILSFKMPRTYGSVTLLFSSADLATGTYTLYKGGSITNNTSEFGGLYTGGSYSGGTSVGSFTVSGMVTSVGSGGGAPR